MVVEASSEFELELHAQGFRVIVGIDEVGRGAIAGPVMVAAAARRNDSPPPPAGLRDSKLLSALQRERLAPLAASWTLAWALGEASPVEIDELGIVACLRLAAERALADLWSQGVSPAETLVLLDGTHNWLKGIEPAPKAVRVRAKADRDCTIVAAASIIAKVERDRQMTLAHQTAPVYAWDGNKGYGSAGHQAAIAEHGTHVLHRQTWIKSTGSSE